MKKADKEIVIGELQKIFTEAKGVYLADFTGVDVESVNDLRQKFRDGNIEYRVVKNTLAKRSLEGLSYDELLPYLNGPTAIAYSYDDEIGPGKVMSDFHKETEKMVLKAAIVDGTFYDEEAVSEIVKLPSRDVLLTRLLGSMNSPITGFVGVLNGVLRNFVGVLDALREKMENEGGLVAVDKPAEEAKEETVAEEVVEAPKEKETKTETESADDKKSESAK